MKSRKFFSTVAAVGLVFAVGCSHDKKKKEPKNQVAQAIEEANRENKPTEMKVTGTETIDVATVEFDRGEANLSEMDRRHLNELALKMTAAGKVVDDVKILTWSDRVVQNDQDGTNTEIILARQRAESIKNFISTNLPEEKNIDFYNMAENPQRYEKYMQAKGIPVNKVFSENGVKTTPDGRALVIIEYSAGPSSSTL